MSQIIEHIAYPDNVLVKIKDWLEDDWFLEISTVNVDHWKSRLRLLRGIWEYEEYGLFDKTHLRFFSVNSFEKLLKETGWKIIDSEYQVDDFTSLFFIPKIKWITISFIYEKLGLFNKKIFKKYRKFFRNFIAYQFVFKTKKEF